ncbi:proepiregulin isoform X1 [Fundulus heteroclitus]|uniref:proepiregulin isoform X1 n=1 Tax=Fundulus heteroclitus TaxID=8078 RepID=UPI000644D145|nr:proepiregulin isoform X1 [Fundulus heteroclitus]
MWTRRPSAFLSFVGVMLIWPHVLSKSISPRLQTIESSFLTAGQEEKRPLMTKRSVTNCESKFDNYCMNSGKCIFLVELKENHCNCEMGFYGSRCENLDIVSKPVGEDQVVLILFCMTLLVMGLGGGLYFFYKWYKKNKFPSQPKRKGYKGVQTI